MNEEKEPSLEQDIEERETDRLRGLAGLLHGVGLIFALGAIIGAVMVVAMFVHNHSLAEDAAPASYFLSVTVLFFCGSLSIFLFLFAQLLHIRALLSR